MSHRGPFIIRAQYHNGFRTQHLAHTKRSGSALAARGRSHSLTLDYIGRWNGGGENIGLCWSNEAKVRSRRGAL